MHEVNSITYNVKFGIGDLFSILFGIRKFKDNDYRFFRKALMFKLSREKRKCMMFKVNKDEYEKISKLIPLVIEVI